jgi:NADPH:quinone reductase-like Zn-dependent oxidoreductase
MAGRSMSRRRAARKVWPALHAGRRGPVIYQVFPFEQVVEAHRVTESSVHIGKLVLDLGA